MFIRVGSDIVEARKQAKANANSTGEPWVIYRDTSGNCRVTRERTAPKEVSEVVDPDPALSCNLWTADNSLESSALGWDMFVTQLPGCESPVLLIRRDDDAGIFADDMEAFQFVVQQAASGNHLALKALNLNHAPVDLKILLIPHRVR